MPCPLFEPQTIADVLREHAARLPLIQEFDGVCHAGEISISAEHRFQYCNQGNARGKCPTFPVSLSTSAIRFAVTKQTPQILSLVLIEEENFWPKRWTQLDFLITEQRLEPELNEVCRRAQALQFCLSYLTWQPGSASCSPIAPPAATFVPEREQEPLAFE